MADQEALATLRQQVHLQEQLQAQQQAIKNQEQQLHEQQQRTQNEPHSSDNSAQPRSGHTPRSSALQRAPPLQRPPPTRTSSPEVWFAQVEAQFSLARITQDRTRYDNVVAHLDSRYAAELRDVHASPPADDCYTCT
ncbi:hypothetical protein HPB49_020239 [Dermacentor silvarum]|uniref:Uncharacterized protein n=1 Tax=Dermacentor silvarum TaxID=543639 RepID=A0ACB8CZN8_DERSI|nr:hypothetical protein HPB49_020239 [Dermacentor silvarum]